MAQASPFRAGFGRRALGFRGGGSGCAERLPGLHPGGGAASHRAHGLLIHGGAPHPGGQAAVGRRPRSGARPTHPAALAVASWGLGFHQAPGGHIGAGLRGLRAVEGLFLSFAPLLADRPDPLRPAGLVLRHRGLRPARPFAIPDRRHPFDYSRLPDLSLRPLGRPHRRQPETVGRNNVSPTEIRHLTI